MDQEYTKLIEYIEKHQVLADEDKDLLVKYFERKDFKKDEILLHQNEVSQKVYFILEGGVHQFYLLENGSQKSCYFSFENTFATDIESFSKRQPAETYLVALEPTKCLMITCQNLSILLLESHNLNTFFRIIMEEVAMSGVKRTKSFLSETPEERYESLLKEQPMLFQRVPQKLIAQYLGIQPESFSRLKKRMTKS